MLHQKLIYYIETIAHLEKTIRNPIIHQDSPAYITHENMRMNALRERADEDRHRFINVQKAFTEADIRAEQLEEEHDKLHLKINRLTKENKRLTHQLQIVENELNQVLRAHERVKAKSGR